MRSLRALWTNAGKSSPYDGLRLVADRVGKWSMRMRIGKEGGLSNSICKKHCPETLSAFGKLVREGPQQSGVELWVLATTKVDRASRSSGIGIGSSASVEVVASAA